jgi:hypothetical protein
MTDESFLPHRPQFASAPDQARKAASADDANAAAAELRPMVGQVRKLAKLRRAALSKRGQDALPPTE